MTIARRFIKAAAELHPDNFSFAADYAEAFDDAIFHATQDSARAALGFPEWGPVTARARAILDRVRADHSHFDAGEGLVPAETVTLLASDYGRRIVAPVVASSIRRAA